MHIAGYLNLHDPTSDVLLYKWTRVCRPGGRAAITVNVPISEISKLDNVLVRIVPDQLVALSDPKVESYVGVPIELSVPVLAGDYNEWLKKSKWQPIEGDAPEP